MQKVVSKLSKVFCLLMLAVSLLCFTGCLSSRIKKSIERGDDLYAIELLSRELTNSPDNLEYVEMFQQVYPSAIEKRIPSKTVDEIINDNLSSYGATTENALRVISRNLSKNVKLSSQKNVAAAVSQSESAVKKLKELVLIQRYVSKMPSTIGKAKKGVIVEVKKYTDDFEGMYEDGLQSLAEFYFAMGQIFENDDSVTRMEEAYNYFVKANSYVSGISGADSKAAETAYNIGEKYEQMNGLTNKKTALIWFKNCTQWDKNYRDAKNKVYEINYLIAVELAKTAKSTREIEEVITYLDAAGTYGNAAQMKIEYQYYLAKVYKSEDNPSSYEKAGKLFTALGNYKDSRYEASLYSFYKRISQLDKKGSYRSTTLSAGNARNNFNSTLQSSSDEYTYVNTSRNTNVLNIFKVIDENVLFPGMIIDGNSVPDQTFREFTAGSRKPVTATIYSSSRTVGKVTIPDPMKRSGGSSIKNEANRFSGSVSPTTDFEYVQVYSTDDLNIALGFGYGKNTISGLDSLFYSGDTVLLLKITQKYFTAEISSPALAVDFFEADSKVPDSSSVSGISPYYVSSVDYGRCGWFIITSELSADELKTDLEKIRPSSSSNYYNKPLYAETSVKWAQKHTNVNALTVSENNSFIRNLDGIYSWLVEGFANGRIVSNLKPISFKLKNLYSNDYALLSSSVKVRVKNPAYNPMPENPVPGTPGNTGTSGTSGTSSGTTGTGMMPPPPPIPGNGTGGTTGTSGTEWTYSNGGETTTTTTSYSVGNEFCAVTFICGNNVYYCKFRDNTTYYYEIKRNDLAYCKCLWDTSRISSLKINGIQMTQNKTIYDFSNVTGNTISFDYEDVDNGNTHKLLVVNVLD